MAPKSSYSKMSDLDLRKRLLDLERAVLDESPSYEEFLLVKRLLASREPAGKPVYSNATSIAEAIEMCFDLHEKPMTSQQVFDELILGGFPVKPLTGRNLVTQTLKYHAKTKRFSQHGDLYGKRLWPSEKFHNLS